MPPQGADNTPRRSSEPRAGPARVRAPDWLRIELDEAATRATGRPTARLVLDLRRPSFWRAVGRGLIRSLLQRFGAHPERGRRPKR
jgi:hypothetical protein